MLFIVIALFLEIPWPVFRTAISPDSRLWKAVYWSTKAMGRHMHPVLFCSVLLHSTPLSPSFPLLSLGSHSSPPLNPGRKYAIYKMHSWFDDQEEEQLVVSDGDLQNRSTEIAERIDLAGSCHLDVCTVCWSRCPVQGRSIGASRR